jgi:hypothetical protein
MIKINQSKVLMFLSVFHLDFRLKTGERRNDLVDLMIDAMKDELKSQEDEVNQDQFERDAVLGHR